MTDQIQEKIKELEEKYSLLLDRLNALNSAFEKKCEEIEELKKLYVIIEQLKLEIQELKNMLKSKNQYITISKKELRDLVAKYIAEKILK